MSPEYFYAIKIEAANNQEARKRQELITLIDGVVAISPLFSPQSETLLSKGAEDEYLSVKEAAAFLNKSLRSVYRYEDLGYINRHTVGKKLRFKRAELETLKQSQT